MFDFPGPRNRKSLTPHPTVPPILHPYVVSLPNERHIHPLPSLGLSLSKVQKDTIKLVPPPHSYHQMTIT